MEIINTAKAPAAIGPYSQGIVYNGMVYTSGQIPIEPTSGELVDGCITEQAEQVMVNLKEVLEAAGAGMDSIIKTTCFIKNMDDFQLFNKVYSKYIVNKPARSCVEVSRMPKDVLCEVEVVAYIK